VSLCLIFSVFAKFAIYHCICNHTLMQCYQKRDPLGIMRLLLGKTLIIVGVLFIVFGAIVLLSGHIPWLGRLPGDIRIKRDGFSFYFPIVTCIIASIVLTIILNILFRLLRR